MPRQRFRRKLHRPALAEQITVADTSTGGQSDCVGTHRDGDAAIEGGCQAHHRHVAVHCDVLQVPPNLEMQAGAEAWHLTLDQQQRKRRASDKVACLGQGSRRHQCQSFQVSITVALYCTARPTKFRTCIERLSALHYTLHTRTLHDAGARSLRD